MRVMYLIFFFCVNCIANERHNHYEIVVNNNLIVCENIQYVTPGYTLIDCVFVEDNRKAPNIIGATNFISVPKNEIR